MNLQNSGAVCRENAHVRHRPRRRTIQYSEALMIKSIARGVLDTPPSRGMRAERGATASAPFRETQSVATALFSIRLLRQIRVRAAEVGGGGILADLDDAAADGAGAGEMLEQRFAVAAADRAGQFR